MDCRQILKLYQLYVDQEMDNSMVDLVKQHMENCPDCQYRVKFEVKFSTIIRKKFKTRSAPDDLKERIKKKLD
ncbi:MAG: zf-HC2 domain-containing protein [bacterium]